MLQPFESFLHYLIVLLKVLVVKTLTGPECMTCAKGVTVGSKVISEVHSGCKGSCEEQEAVVQWKRKVESGIGVKI